MTIWWAILLLPPMSVGSHIGFGMQFGTIEKRPAFERYWQRLAQRPAALRAKQIDDALASPPPAPPGR